MLSGSIHTTTFQRTLTGDTEAAINSQIALVWMEVNTFIATLSPRNLLDLKVATVPINYGHGTVAKSTFYQVIVIYFTIP